MKEIRTYILFFLLFLALSGSMGCGKEPNEESGFCVYYLNKESTKIVSAPYELTSKKEDTNAVIDELLEQLKADTGDVEMVKPIPDGVEVTGYNLEETLLTLYFNDAYSSMDGIKEVLTRAAVVRTLMQVEQVECLSFYVGDIPLADRKGNPVGIMTDESFIENPGEQINSIQTANLVLYFANQKGNALVRGPVCHSGGYEADERIRGRRRMLCQPGRELFKPELQYRRTNRNLLYCQFAVGSFYDQ